MGQIHPRCALAALTLSTTKELGRPADVHWDWVPLYHQQTLMYFSLSLHCTHVGWCHITLSLNGPHYTKWSDSITGWSCFYNNVVLTLSRVVQALFLSSPVSIRVVLIQLLNGTGSITVVLAPLVQSAPITQWS